MFILYLLYTKQPQTPQSVEDTDWQGKLWSLMNLKYTWKHSINMSLLAPTDSWTSRFPVTTTFCHSDLARSPAPAVGEREGIKIYQSPARRVPVSFSMLLFHSHNKVNFNIPLWQIKQPRACLQFLWNYNFLISLLTSMSKPASSQSRAALLASAEVKGNNWLGENKIHSRGNCRHDGSPGRWEPWAELTAM